LSPPLPKENQAKPLQSQLLVQEEKRERIVPSTSPSIKPQPTRQPSIPKQERAAPKQSTMSSSDSLAKQAPSPTNGRNTTGMVNPSRSCSP
jgi:hypothetical protein